MSFADGDIADLVAPVPHELVEYGEGVEEVRVLKATWRGYSRLKEQEEVLARKVSGWKASNAEGGRLHPRVVRRKPAKEELTKGGHRSTVIPKVFDTFKPDRPPAHEREGYRGPSALAGGGAARGRIRPASAAARLRPGSATSHLGHHQDDELTYPSRPTSAAVSRPTSAAQSRPTSARSRPRSAGVRRRSPRSRPVSAKSHYTIASSVEDSTVGPSTSAPTQKAPARKYNTAAEEFWSDDGEDDASALIDKISLAPSPTVAPAPRRPAPPARHEHMVRFGEATSGHHTPAPSRGAPAAPKTFYRTPVERIGSLYSLSAWCRTKAAHAALADSTHSKPPPERLRRWSVTPGDPYPDLLNPLGQEERGALGVDPQTSHFLNLHDFLAAEMDAGFSIPALLAEAQAAASKEQPQPRRRSSAAGAVAAPKGVPARSQYHHRTGEVKWERCVIVDYRADSETYKIEWAFTPPAHDPQTRIGAEAVEEAESTFAERPKPKWVQRLNLIVDGWEDEAVWEGKVEAARVLRDAAEKQVREHLYIDDLDDAVIAPLTQAQIDRIVALVGRSYAPQEQYLLEKGVNELRSSFLHSCKEAVYRYKMLLPAERARVANLNIPDRAADAALSKPEDHVDMLDLRGTVDIKVEPGTTSLQKFHKARQYIADNLFFTHRILFHTLYKLVAKWGAFESSKLFDSEHPALPTPCEVDAFRVHQYDTLCGVTERLKQEWNVHAVSIIQSDLVGHVSFYDDDLTRFRESRMARFLRVVNMIMGHQLQELIYTAVDEYSTYMKQYKAHHPWLEQQTVEPVVSPPEAVGAFAKDFQGFDAGPEGSGRRPSVPVSEGDEAARPTTGMRGKKRGSRNPRPPGRAGRGSRTGSRVSFTEGADSGNAPRRRSSAASAASASSAASRRPSLAEIAEQQEDQRLKSRRRKSLPCFLTFVGAWYDPKAPVGPPVLRLCHLPRASAAEVQRRKTIEEKKMRVYMGYGEDDERAPRKGTLDYVREKHRASLRYSEDLQLDVEDEDLDTFKKRLSQASTDGKGKKKETTNKEKFVAPWEMKRQSEGHGLSRAPSTSNEPSRITAPSSTMPTSGAVSLFRIRLTTSNTGQIVFEPSLDDIETTVRGVLAGLFSETDDITGVGPQLFPVLGLEPFGLTASTRAMMHSAAPVLEAKAVVDEVLEKNMVGPKMLHDLYMDFQYLLDIDTEAYLQEFLQAEPPAKLEDYRYLCTRIQTDIEAIQLCSLNEVAFPLIKVECYDVKANLVKKAKEVMTAILAHLTQQCNDDIMRVDRKYNEYLEGIRVHPHTPEDLRDLKVYVDDVPKRLTELLEDFQAITNTVQVLAQFGYTPEQRSFETYWATYSRPRTITEELQDFDFRYRENRNRFMHALRDNTETLVEKVNQTKKQVDLLAYEDDELRMEEMYVLVQRLRVQLTECREDATLYNTHEEIFRLPTTKHPLIREVTQQFEPYEKLWSIAQHFTEHHEKWVNGSLLSLQAEEVQQKATQWLKELGRLQRLLANEAPCIIVRQIRDKLEQFKPHIPLITALLERGMKPRHWEQMGKLIGREGKNKLVPSDELTLNQLIDAGLAKKLFDVQMISETASKEWGLEHQLERMKAEWKGKQFKLQSYRETYLLTSVEDFQSMLDDHIVRTEMLLASLDVKHIEDMVRKWEAQLDRMAKIIDDWLRFQNMWHYLEPVFDSEDLQNSMPAEYTQFKKIDAMWRSVMQVCANDPRVETRCSEDSLVRTFDECNKHLEYILKQLHKFLDTKRTAFPRFYFLSNEDLIDVLSDAKHPPVVQRHLKKCFEGIASLAFADGDNYVITEFHSALGEKLPLGTPVAPGDHGWLCEKWLGAVETGMKASVLQHIRDAMAAYGAQDCAASPEARMPWIDAWPGQVVLTVAQVFWAKEVEAAILAGVTGLTLHTSRAKNHLNALVDRVRGDLTRVARTTLQSMIVIEVHAMDIVEKELIQNGVADLSAFAWQAQLRYSYEEVKPVDRKKYMGVVVKQTEAAIPYGNEYLGNTDRLVITPLTDRCYRTLIGAMHLSYGGAPEGPAGTGKTETVKDLAKSLAKYCLVRNCSEQISHVEMAKMFRGLTASGSWACFDEFNRIETQVLSVIAQQILSIQVAISQGRCEFDFEGTFTALEAGCAVFITMNPGYAGRSELPDNLKARFRPVAMMVPDYALIAEISLFACGFREGRSLSGKIVATYKLCSEQLSSQRHYDYGMRAVKSVLNAARAIRGEMDMVPGQSAEEISTEEARVVLKAINDVNLPKFLPEDLQLFRMLARDLFPEVAAEEEGEPTYDELLDGLLDACEMLQLQPSEALVHKAYQVNTTINVRHGLMLIGDTYSGKSTALSALAHAFEYAPASRRGSKESRDSEEDPDAAADEPGDDDEEAEAMRVSVSHINPKSITIGQLYGSNDAALEWDDGVLSSVFKAASVDTSLRKHWIVLDGPVDAEWIESMNTVLDDNRKLCLVNGDNIQLTEQMRMMFEVDNLNVASPATVSRCGMVHFDSNTVVTPDALIACWLAHLPEDVKGVAACAEGVAALPSMLHRFVEPCLRFLFPSPADLQSGVCEGLQVPNNMSVKPIALVGNFLRLLKAELIAVATKHVTEKTTMKDCCLWMEGVFVFCLVWGLGGWLAPQDRPAFGTLIAKLVKERKKDKGKKGATATPKTEPDGKDASPAPAPADDAPLPPAEGSPVPAEDGEADETPGSPVGSPQGRRRSSRRPSGRWTCEHFHEMTLALPDCFGVGADARTVYDYSFDILPTGGYAWPMWLETIPTFTISDDARYHEIAVPTAQHVCMGYLLDRVVAASIPVLFSGATGTGKSLLMHVAADRARTQGLTSNYLQFTGRTTCASAQSLLENRLERRAKGVYGPPLGQKCIVFIDDIAMPQVEASGAQPAIELLRQWLDTSGWYDTSKGSVGFKQVHGLTLVGGVTPGGNDVTSRALRHFLPVAMSEHDPATLKEIFGTLLEFVRTTNRWAPEFDTTKAQQLVAASIDFFAQVRARLIARPDRPFYTFNIRDISKVFHGLSMVPFEGVPTELDVSKLWLHETMRVYQDRIVDEEDMTWFADALSATSQKHTGRSIRDLREGAPIGRPLIFDETRRDAKDPPVLCEVRDMEAFRQDVELAQQKFNAEINMSDAPLTLIVFDYVLEHVSRLSRILRLPAGHALVIGLGGRGRQSVVQLAAYMCEQKLARVLPQKHYTREAWRDDLRGAIKGAAAGVPDPTTFLLTDGDIADECFLEDIACLLSTGEVPLLFADEDRQQIVDSILKVAKELGRRDLTEEMAYRQFISRVRTDFHVVMCFSPVGTTLRQRLRALPSLVNCCAVDYFKAWPLAGLESVGTKLLETALDGVECTTAQYERVLRNMVAMHQDAKEAVREYQQETQQEIHITPTSYLELLHVFGQICKQQGGEAVMLTDRYSKGVDQIHSTEETVIVMQGLLEIQQPRLNQMASETAQLIDSITAEEADADVTREAVAVEEAAAMEKADEAKKIKDSCEAVLAKVMPILEAAMAQVADIDKRQINELRTMTHPSENIKNVMAAVCVCLGVAPAMVAEQGQTGRNAKRKPDYWGPAKKLMSDSNEFTNMLLTYKDRDGGLDPEIFESDTGKIQHFVKDKAFAPEKVRMLSKALAPMCAWVIAMEKYYQVEKRIRPKRAELEVAQEEYDTAMAHLNVKKEELAKVDARLLDMRQRLKHCTDQKNHLTNQYEETVKKLERAKKVIAGLGGEKDRFQKAAVTQRALQEHVLGDSLVAASYFAYLAPFAQGFRQGLLEKWMQQVGRTLPLTEGFSLQSFLGNEIAVEDWKLQGLPVDGFSIDNAIVAEHTLRTPCFIDPQQQAAAWLKERFAKQHIQVLSPHQDGYLRSIAVAVQTGVPILLEIPGNEIDAMLHPLLQKQGKPSAQARLTLGDQEVTYHKNWTDEVPLEKRARLWIATTHPLPNFTPEVAGRVELINMAITQEGLQNQVLGRISLSEERTLEAKRVRNLRLGAQNKKALKEKEQEILELLSQPGSVLDNEDTITALTTSRKVAEQTAISQKEVERILQQCERTKKRFQDVGESVASLFFCVANLHAVDSMYQFSLDWFLKLFCKCLDTSRNDRVDPASLSETDRPNEIQNVFFDAFYKIVTRALFAKDHLVFSFLMAVAVTPNIPAEDVRIFCTGGREMTDAELEEYETRRPDWLPRPTWRNVVKLSTQTEAFKTLVASIAQQEEEKKAGLLGGGRNGSQWEAWHGADAPETMQLPEPWDAAAKFEGSSPLHRLLLLRVFRPDRLQTAVTRHVADHPMLGPKFTVAPVFDLTSLFRETDCLQPIIFILSTGVDPVMDLQRIAKDEHMTQKFHTMALGSGMRERAERLIADGRNNGWWVVLQNCHLYRDWLPFLARIIEDYSRGTRSQSVHPDFRLWLSTKTTPHFPPAVLQSGYKLVFEAPKGLKANLLNSYTSTLLRDSDFYDTVSQPVVWKKLVYALCFFHAVVQGRRQYGPMGFNRTYEFTKADLVISLQQLRHFVHNQEAVAYDALIYLTGECHYGGRVTDDRDRRCLMATLCSLYSEKVLDANFSFDPENIKYVLPDMRVEEAVPFIERLPHETSASVFGLHANADIARNTRESMQLLESVLLSRPRVGRSGGGGGGGAAQQDGAKKGSEGLLAACDAYAEALPEPFDALLVKSKFPVSYEQSMNTVLVMEIGRYNELIEHIAASLTRVAGALRGDTLITQDIEQVCEELAAGKVPREWLAKSYPSLKPLGAYLADLSDRCQFFADWVAKEGVPSVYWIPGFFFTQSFLTAVMQNYARRHKAPIDSLQWGFETRSETAHFLSLRDPLADGGYVSGMHLEGARWDPGRKCITDADPGQLYDEYPVVEIKLHQRRPRPHTTGPAADGSVSPSRLARPTDEQFGTFTGDTGSVMTPLYKTAERKGELSTTGHDSNFVMMFEVPINPHGGAESFPEFWIQRGVALLCQLPH